MIYLKFHHGGSFCKDNHGKSMYMNEVVDEWPETDEDQLDVFSMWGYSKMIGYIELSNVYWLVPNEPLETGLRALVSDDDVIEMVKASKSNAGVIHIYYEHPITQPEILSNVVVIDEDNQEESHDNKSADKQKNNSGVRRKNAPQKRMGDAELKDAEKNKGDAETNKFDAERKKLETEWKQIEAEKKKIEADKKKVESEKKKAEAERKKAEDQRKKAEDQRKKAEADKKKVEAERKKVEADKKKAESERKKVEADKKKAESEMKKVEDQRKKAESDMKKVEEEKKKAEAERKKVEEEKNKDGAKRKKTDTDRNKGKNVVVESDSESESDTDYDPDIDDYELMTESDDEILVGDCVGHRQNYESTIYQDEGEDSWRSEVLKSPINSGDEADSKEVNPQFNEHATFGHVNIEVGMQFNTLEIFKNAVKEWNINIGRPIYWVKNDKVRARARCKNELCNWEICCSWCKVSNAFIVKLFEDKHTCSRQFKNQQANQDWVTRKLINKLVKHPNMKNSEALDYLKRKFGVHLNQTLIYRSMVGARKVVEGSELEQYAKLWDYCHELMNTNPGSTVKMDTIPMLEGNPQFHRLYICLAGCRDGFKAGCRPLIGLDGAFLKGYYGGQLLSAVGQDANNHIYPIAYAVVDVENKDNWKWFLELLHLDLGHFKEHGWNFISDMQKGLIPALQEVMPGVHHRLCVWHLWQNFCKQWKDNELRKLLWECARSTTKVQFKHNMELLKRISEDAWAYLDKWRKLNPTTTWTKAEFSEFPKIDNICNNNCEVFNAKIVSYRGKTILTMLEEIRSYIMGTISSNKLKLSTCNGPLTPIQQSRLDKEKRESNFWTPIWAGDDNGCEYEVKCGRTQVSINLLAQTCTCRFWQLTGMPCMHVVAACAHKGHKPEDYCHASLTMASYMATYQHHIHPVRGEQYWEKSGNLVPIPPPFKRKPGRPKKQRRKNGKEAVVNPKKLKRKVATFTCSCCGGKKHNKLGCPVYKRQKLEEEAAEAAKAAETATAADTTMDGAAADVIVASQNAPPAEVILASQTAPPAEPILASQTAPPEEVDSTQSDPPGPLMLRLKLPIRKDHQ